MKENQEAKDSSVPRDESPERIWIFQRTADGFVYREWSREPASASYDQPIEYVRADLVAPQVPADEKWIEVVAEKLVKATRHRFDRMIKLLTVDETKTLISYYYRNASVPTTENKFLHSVDPLVREIATKMERFLACATDQEFIAALDAAEWGIVHDIPTTSGGAPATCVWTLQSDQYGDVWETECGDCDKTLIEKHIAVEDDDG